MVPLSIMGMTGWVNLFFLAVRRPGTLSVARRRSTGAFFMENPGALPSGGSVVGGGSRWRDTACNAPGRHTRHTQDRTPWLQVVPAAGYRICRGQDRQNRAGTLRRLRREQRRVEWLGLQCGALMSERN